MNKELTKEDFSNILYKRDIDSHKGIFGYIALVGGSEKYSGAIKLASMANASMRAGTGVCKVAAPKSLYEIIAKNILEATFYPLSCNGYDLKFVDKEFEELMIGTKVIAIGMGIGNNLETKKAINFLLEKFTGILLIDADGINALTNLDDKILINTKAKVVLTPHVKEFYRLLCFSKNIMNIDFSIINEKEAINIIKEKRQLLAIEFAKKYNLCLLLKGNENVITNGDEIYIIKKGTPGMATAGSGDVLSGIASAIIGYNEKNILKALAVACYINGLSGELAVKDVNEISMIASDTIKYIPKAIDIVKNV